MPKSPQLNDGFNGGDFYASKVSEGRERTTAIEYGLIATLVAVACISALTAMGTSLSSLFNTVKTKVDTAKTP